MDTYSTVTMETNSDYYIVYTTVRPLQILRVVVGIAIIVVNTIVIIAYAIDRDIRRVPANVFIISLSISDFITGLEVLIQVMWTSTAPVIHIFESNLCLAAGAFRYGSFLLSVIMVIFISWDRFQLLSDPFKYRLRTVRGNVKVAISGWCLSLVYILMLIFMYPPLYQLLRGNMAEKTICVETRLPRPHVVFSLFIEFLLPLAIIIFLNGGVVYKLHRTTYEKLKKQREELQGTDSAAVADFSSISQANGSLDSCQPEPNTSTLNGQDAGISYLPDGLRDTLHRSAREERLKKSIKKEWNKVRRTARLLHLFVFVFIVCWLPFYVIITVDWFTPVDDRRITGSSLNLSFNSLLNPFLYAFMSRKFRRRFQLMAMCKKG